MYKRKHRSRLYTAILLFKFPNPLNSARDILKYSGAKVDISDLENLPSPSATYNFPFFHRSHRDYSGIANEWQELVPKYITAFKHISADMISDIMDGVLSGLFYEQNKLVQAKEKIIGLLGRLNEKSHPEFWFSAYMHLAIIAFAEADEKGARNSINMAKSIIERNGSYLVKNLDAVITKYRLYKGDAGAAREWLSNYAAGDLSTVKFYQIYQAFTTIRAYIATGNFALAQVLMAGVEKLAVNYKRPLDHIEILILKSIVFWKEKQQTKAVESMEEAVRLAKPYGFTRIFACEGAAVIPVLQKLCNRISVWPEETDTVVFVRTILLLANETAKFYPGLTSSIEEKPIKLSKQQMRMLLYLAAGKNNRRICSETGLKLNAVKAHLFKLYEKLEVNNSTEAVLKSYQLGIIEKNHL